MPLPAHLHPFAIARDTIRQLHRLALSSLLLGCGVQELSHPGVTHSAPAETMIELGGEPVAHDDAIAFLHFGHSNMAGRATLPDELHAYFFDDVDPRAWTFHAPDDMRAALEPYTAGELQLGQLAGPGTALVKEAARRAPTKHFISLGFGHGSAYCTQFLPGSLYYDSVMAGARILKGHVTFGGIVVMLGITERHGTAEDIANYSTCIAQLTAAIRDELDEPELPLLITDYEREATGIYAVERAFAQSIIPEIAKVPQVVPNSVLVPTDGLAMQDNHHFNMQGHVDWVGRLLDLMQARGWFPWASSH